jgi:hypothetical protein
MEGMKEVWVWGWSLVFVFGLWGWFLILVLMRGWIKPKDPRPKTKDLSN